LLVLSSELVKFLHGMFIIVEWWTVVYRLWFCTFLGGRGGRGRVILKQSRILLIAFPRRMRHFCIVYLNLAYPTKEIGEEVLRKWAVE
jgi:hypothetical protein